MNGKQHFQTTAIILTLAILLLHLENYITQREEVVLAVSILIFSALLTPDIDLKIPLLPHRGPTHSPTSILIFFSLIGIVLYFVFNSNGLSEYSKYILFGVGGAIIGWCLHVFEDKFIPKHELLMWGTLLALAIVAFFIVK